MVLEIPGGLFGQGDVRETSLNDAGTTAYVSVGGIAFIADEPDTEDWNYTAGAVAINATGGTNTPVFAIIQIPHGVTVTAAGVWGSGPTGNYWVLKRVGIGNGTAETMATANIDTEDTTIAYPVIDNSLYFYVLEARCDDGESIYGGRVTYTI